MAKRHRWEWDQGEHSWGEKWTSDRSKTCQDCGLRADRFGVGRDSYWTWTYPDGHMIDSHDHATPPCEVTLIVVEDLGREPLRQAEVVEEMLDKVMRSRIPARIDDPLQRCMHCKWCNYGLQRWSLDEPWVSVFGNVQCEKAPLVDGDAFGGHEPGSPVATRPDPEPEPEPEMVPDLSVLPAPVIPIIPKMGA